MGSCTLMCQLKGHVTGVPAVVGVGELDGVGGWQQRNSGSTGEKESNGER